MNPAFYKKKCCCGGTPPDPPTYQCADYGSPGYPLSLSSDDCCNTSQKTTWSPVVTFQGPSIYRKSKYEGDCCKMTQSSSDEGCGNDCGHVDGEPLYDCEFTNVFKKRLSSCVNQPGGWDTECPCIREFQYGSGAVGFSNAAVWRGRGSNPPALCGLGVLPGDLDRCRGAAQGTVNAYGGTYETSISFSFGACTQNGYLYRPSLPGGSAPPSAFCSTEQWYPPGFYSANEDYRLQGDPLCEGYEDNDSCYYIEPGKYWGVVSGWGPVSTSVSCEDEGSCDSESPCPELTGTGAYSPFEILMIGTPSTSIWPGQPCDASVSGINYVTAEGWTKIYGSCLKGCQEQSGNAGSICDCDPENALDYRAKAGTASCSSFFMPMSCSDWTQFPTYCPDINNLCC